MSAVIESAVPIAPPASKLEQLIAKQAALELWWAACVELEAELTSGELGGPAVRYSFRSLNEILVLARATPSEQASGEADQARELYLEAWALSRIGQFSMSDESLGLGERALDDSLALFARAATLLHLESPPLLTAAPSISRTRNKAKKLDLAPRDGWVCGLLVDYARAEATRSFAACLAQSEEGEEGSETGEELLANMIELACRRNVQALFTPVIEGTSSDADAAAQASTVLGNTRLLADMISMSDWSPIVSQRRVAWATHIADVNYVQASMCANRLLESAGLAARLLVDKNASEVEKEQTRRTLEATVKRLIPFEVQQGKSLLGLGKIMMAACRNSKQVGGGDLMKESIAVLTRAAQHFENAYSSFGRSKGPQRSAKQEQRMLRRLERLYCTLETLDDSSAESKILRGRAVSINDRLRVLTEQDNGEAEEAEDEEDEYESEDDEETVGDVGLEEEAEDGSSMPVPVSLEGLKLI